MPSPKQLKAAIEELLTQSMMPEDEVSVLFQKAVDREYWRILSPSMGLKAQQSLDKLEDAPLSSEQETLALAHLERHGYFRMPTFIARAAVARMCSSVETLRSAGWPAVFSYVYDEFWAVLRTPSVVHFLSRKYGAGYLQTAGVWTYRVDPRTRSYGWSPHVDSRNNPERLTVWIPLSDATIGNGCIYVIPQDCVPSALPASYSDWRSVSRRELEVLLHNVTPLPAAPGSVLGWNHRLIHWGGRAMESAACPRISIAAEFLPQGTRPESWEIPVFDSTLPDFAVRLRVISQAILAYEKFELAMRRFHDLATKLIEWGG
jgi:Phytanoyl-CoA dioxygenase (PhyH)